MNSDLERYIELHEHYIGVGLDDRWKEIESLKAKIEQDLEKLDAIRGLVKKDPYMKALVIIEDIRHILQIPIKHDKSINVGGKK